MHKAKLSEAEMLKEDLKCFHSRVPFTEDVLGIGISIKYSKRNRNIEAIESPLDLLSYTAFNDGVRESVYNFSGEKYNNYTHWLPVCKYRTMVRVVTRLILFQTSTKNTAKELCRL
jgi:hypothetical protein